jgi:hypothetical protein
MLVVVGVAVPLNKISGLAHCALAVTLHNSGGMLTAISSSHRCSEKRGTGRRHDVPEPLSRSKCELRFIFMVEMLL